MDRKPRRLYVYRDGNLVGSRLTARDYRAVLLRVTGEGDVKPVSWHTSFSLALKAQKAQQLWIRESERLEITSEVQEVWAYEGDAK